MEAMREHTIRKVFILESRMCLILFPTELHLQLYIVHLTKGGGKVTATPTKSIDNSFTCIDPSKC
jgi:hypothetical protein